MVALSSHGDLDHDLQLDFENTEVFSYRAYPGEDFLSEIEFAPSSWQSDWPRRKTQCKRF